MYSESGTPGASARQEYERRRASRERRIRRQHPRIGGLLLALREAPLHETVWARGAEGEERVGRRLAELCEEHVLLLHDRRIPGKRANIDHLAIARGGVWVIDSKRRRGPVVIERPLAGEPKLKIGGRDCSLLVDGLAWQTELVTRALADSAPDVPVHGALCFVDADLPLLRKLTFRGYPLLYPKTLAKRLNAPGDLSPARAQAVADALAAAFPRAVASL